MIDVNDVLRETGDAIKCIPCRFLGMDIHRLYQLIKMWEVALTLTKPSGIKSIRLKPIIDNDIEGCGEGKIYGAIEFTLIREDAYTIDTLIDVYKEYKTIEEGKEAQKEMILCLTDYLEQFLSEDTVTLIWNQIDDLALDWYEGSPD